MTVALSMITNDAQSTIDILDKYGQYFDKWFITVADKDKKQYKIVEAYAMEHDRLVISYFKWEDNFGKAREFNRQQIDTDYFFWIDSDDEISNPELLPDAFDQIVKSGADALTMKYDYQHNELNEATGDHWRERLVKTKHFKWSQSRCHETLIAPSAEMYRYYDIVVLHNKTPEMEQKSFERNIRLLELDFNETEDPRTAMYLGDNYTAIKEYDKALFYLTFLLKNGGWEEDKYRAWLKVAEIHFIKGEYSQAIQFCNAAEELLPDWPDAYYLKASIYKDLEKPKNVYEYVKTAVIKGRPKTASVINPTLYEYRGLFLGALAAAELGKIEESYKMLQAVLAKSPNYKPALDLMPIIEEAYLDSKAIDMTKWLLHYSKANKGNIEKFLAGLPARIVADPRLNAERAKLLPSKKWPAKSIVFYCGPGGEAWGPDTLEKGMGGSEEAIVYLSRELAKLGHDVTVFNDREEEYIDVIDTSSDIRPVIGDNEFKFKPEGSYKLGNKPHEFNVITIDQPIVTYKPWTLLNPHDEFDTFVAWRAPENTRGVKAKQILVDLHDTVPSDRVYLMAEENKDLKYMVKSNYHRNLYPDLSDNRFVIIGNGIVKEQFNG